MTPKRTHHRPHTHAMATLLAAARDVHTAQRVWFDDFVRLDRTACRPSASRPDPDGHPAC